MYSKNTIIQGSVMPVIIIICFSFFISGCISLQPVPETIQSELEDAVTRGLDGIIVYVDKPGTSMSYTAGWKNRDKKEVADPDALFKIASISKLYLAAAAAKLVHTQMLYLDQSLAHYLPALKDRIEYADQITVRMLLQHRSGIPEFIDHPDFPWTNPPYNKEVALDLVLNQPADFTPGKKYRYCNTNYLLVGEILDTILGYSHHQFIKSEILIPLGLNNTYSLLSEVNTDELMSGYFVDYAYDIKNNDYSIPGGSMIATAQDVGIFLRALHNGTLLNDDEQTIYSSIYEFEHTGDLPGYLSIARYHEDLDAVVIQFINTSGGRSWSKAESVYRRIIRILEKN